MSTFPERLRSSMNAKGFNNLSLAKELGITHTSVARWLSGSQPRGETLHRLAETLNVPATWLMLGEDREGSSVVREDPVVYGQKDTFADEIVRLAESANIQDLLDTMENLNRRATAGDNVASITVSKLIPIVRKRMEAYGVPHPP